MEHTYLRNLLQRYKNNAKFSIGYSPVVELAHLDYLAPFFYYPGNNIGDPQNNNFNFSTKEFELAVLDWFMKIYKTSRKESWGYVTSGSSESILFGLWQGRHYLKRLSHKPIVLMVSQHAHYAYVKNSSIVDVPICYIKTDDKENLLIEDFIHKIQQYKDHSILFGATFGTTLTSAIDPIDPFLEQVKKLNIPYYIHVDAAFDGVFLPFLDSAYTMKNMHSVNVSTHKFLGSPIPAAVVLVKRSVLMDPPKIEYIQAYDNTISGSRDAFSPLYCYESIVHLNEQGGVMGKYQRLLGLANKMMQLFQENGIEAWKREQALNIVLPHCPKEICKKWFFPSQGLWSSLTVNDGKLTIDKVYNIIQDYKKVLHHKPLDGGGDLDWLKVPSLNVL